MVDLHVKSSKEEEVNRDEIAAKIQANPELPGQKQLLRKSASSDQPRQVQAAAPAGMPDRASIRAALIGQTDADPARAAKEESDAARRQEEEVEMLAEQRRYRKELEAQQHKDEPKRRAEEREEARKAIDAFLKPDWVVRTIRTDIVDGALCYLAVGYDNGLLVEKRMVGIKPSIIQTAMY